MKSTIRLREELRVTDGVGGEQGPSDRAMGLEIRVVDSGKEIARFNRYLAARHYLGETRPVGDFLRQVVTEGGRWVALLAWGSACYRIKDRDRWIGWNNTQRAERQKLVVQNRRYLLLHPRGERPNLGSQVLGLAVRELAGQWEQRFGYRPVLAETFTDIEAYAGTCYKASGWEAVGQSAGYSRHRAERYVKNDRPKKLWLKKLQRDAREVLCAASLSSCQAEGGKSNAHGQLPVDAVQQSSLLEALGQVADRRAANRRFGLAQVLAIVAMALLAGARDLSQIYRFGLRLTQAQRKRLGMPLKKGTVVRSVPCYSVYYKTLRNIEPQDFAQVLNRWLASQEGSLPASLALDGKMIGELVGVLTVADHQTGAPVAMAPMSRKEGTEGRCELKTAQDLIRSRTWDGQLITTDALHTQKETAQDVVEQGGDYLMQIKGNQKTLLKVARRQTDRLRPLFR